MLLHITTYNVRFELQDNLATILHVTLNCSYNENMNCPQILYFHTDISPAWTPRNKPILLTSCVTNNNSFSIIKD